MERSRDELCESESGGRASQLAIAIDEEIYRIRGQAAEFVQSYKVHNVQHNTPCNALFTPRPSAVFSAVCLLKSAGLGEMGLSAVCVPRPLRPY